MQINITEETAEVLVRLNDRYYFDLFKSIRTDINEEYVFRNAISEVANEIKKQWQTPDLGLLPVVVIDKDESNRMASTIRHNRARGTHDIDLMVSMVGELVESGMSDQWIMKNLGIDADELLRLKQISGIAALFANEEFSKGWEKV